MLDFFRVVPKQRKVKIRSKTGVIFSNPSNWRKITFYIGTGCFGLGIVFLIYLYYPLIRVIVMVKSQGYKAEEIALTIETNQIIDQSYYIQIPKILARAEVFTDVPPFDAKEYMKILDQNVVAQIKGSSNPGGGKGKTTYIFAHSTNSGVSMVRKNAIFYLLGDLKNSDLVFLQYKGKIFKYKVYKQLIIGANQVEYLGYKEDDKELLILQTCWPIGTDWKRLLVFAERIE